MIYLVKEENYEGIDPTKLKDDAINMLLDKGASKDAPYSKPSIYKGTQDEWKELDNEAKQEIKYFLTLNEGILLTENEYTKIFSHVKVLSLLSQDNVLHEVNIDLEALSDKIMNKVIHNASHLYNQKLEVHQPNMPLFQYNDYHVLVDQCTDALQTDYIDKGYRVVCIMPQPDQRRPDYIVARYIKEE